MNYLTTSTLTVLQKQQIITLWNAEFVTTIQLGGIEDFDQYLSGLKDHRHILMVDETGVVKGWFFDFDREGERWFAMIISAEYQGKGYGGILLNRGKAVNTELNGWVVNSSGYTIAGGGAYKPPLDFYRKNGFEIFPEIVSEKPQLKTIKITWRLTCSKK